jgi:hypothetical protein
MRIRGFRSSSSTRRRIILQVMVASAITFLAAAHTVPAEPTPGPCPSRITDLQVSRAEGLTRVLLEFDEDIQPTCWRSFRLTEPNPREVVILRGIGAKWEPATLDVGDPVVKRIRTGFHPERNPSELHLVIDLSTADARIIDARASGHLLVLLVGRPGSAAPVTASPAPPPATAAPSPRPYAILPSPTLTAVVAATPTAAPPPDLTPTPQEVPQSTAVTEPTPAPGPAPLIAPQPLPTTTDSTPAPLPDASRPQVIQIVVTPRGTDGTLIRITADRSLPFGTHRLVSIDRDPPRAVLRLKGVEIGPGVERIRHFDDVNVASVRLVAADDVAPHEVHVVLSLTNADVKLREIAARGEHLVISVERISDPPGPQD